MFQASHSAVVEQIAVPDDLSNSDIAASAAVLVRNVNGAVKSVSTARTNEPHANIATWQVITSGVQTARVPVIDPPPAPKRPAPRASLHALQEWEGYVLEIGETDFVARLVDLTADASHEGEEAIIPRAELSEGEDAKMRAGSIFRWVIGYRWSPEGTKERVSRIVFRDLPAITSSDLREGEGWAQEMARSLNQ